VIAGVCRRRIVIHRLPSPSAPALPACGWPYTGDRIALSPASVSLTAVLWSLPWISIQPWLTSRLSIISPAGIGRRLANLQSVKLKCCMMARWGMFGPLAELPMVISPLPSVQLYKSADCLKIACWCNGSCNVRMAIIRRTPCCRSEISGEGKARSYDEANGEPAHASLHGV